MTRPVSPSANRHGLAVLFLGLFIAVLSIALPTVVVQTPWWSKAYSLNPSGICFVIGMAGVWILRYWWTASEGRWPVLNWKSATLAVAWLAFAPAGFLVLFQPFFERVFWLPGQQPDPLPAGLFWLAVSLWVRLAAVLAAALDVVAITIWGSQLLLLATMQGLRLIGAPQRYYAERTFFGRRVSVGELGKKAPRRPSQR